MTIYVDDNDVCPKCGAYWTTGKFWCCNGHPNPNIQPDEKRLKKLQKEERKKITEYERISQAVMDATDRESEKIKK